MTKSFWHHFGAVLSLGAALIVLLTRADGALRTVATLIPYSPSIAHFELAAFLVLPFYVYCAARFSVRVTHDDGTAGLLTAYAGTLLVPVFTEVVATPQHTVALGLVLLGIVELLDSRHAGGHAARAGVYATIAGALLPGLIPVVALMIPPSLILSRGRVQRLTFAATVAAGSALLALVLAAGPGGGLAVPGIGGTNARMAVHVGAWRFLTDTYFLGVYAPLAAAAFLVPDRTHARTGSYTLLWIAGSTMAVLLMGAAQGEAVASCYAIMLLALAGMANAGVCALRRGERSGGALGALYLLPVVVGGLRLLIHLEATL